MPVASPASSPTSPSASAEASVRDKKPPRRVVPGGRWISVALRAVHLLCVIWLGAAVHGAPLDARNIALLVLFTGALLFALDLYAYPHHLKEVAGLSVVFKLLLVASMAAGDAARLPLFWSIVLWSAVFSHAPGSLRHRRVF